MDPIDLRKLLENIASGAVKPDEAIKKLRRLPFADVALARIDHHRYLRQGFPEAIFGPGKSIKDLKVVLTELLSEGIGPVILTRASEDQLETALTLDPTGEIFGQTAVWKRAAPQKAEVLVITAGTADRPVADECTAVLWAYGLQSNLLIDAGVAGLHRLLADLDRVQNADGVIVVAGMEGALASVVGGLTGAPIIAVPTSVGYGASLDGVTALLSMHASCASGLSVVGIDNGFGAACAMLRILSPLNKENTN